MRAREFAVGSVLKLENRTDTDFDTVATKPGSARVLVPTVLRGNAVFDAPRRPVDVTTTEDAERPGRHSHAERGNE